MNPSAYPLQWPSGWPRTTRVEPSRFRTTLAASLSLLKKECASLGGKSLVLSSNCTLGNENPRDPGVVAYFELQGRHLAIPCDRWNKVCDNVKAIALTIEAMRGMDRWGAKHMISAMFSGFVALPQQTVRSCWEVLGIPVWDGANPPYLYELESGILAAFRERAKVCPPDVGGSSEEFSDLVRAKEMALQIVRGGAK